MKIQPLRDQVLVKRQKEPDTTAGGLFVPTTAQTKSRRGEVLAVGPGRYTNDGQRIPVGVNPGMVVYFRGVAGQEVTIDNEDFVILKEDEIEGVVTED